jgi:hypothetical protein
MGKSKITDPVYVHVQCPVLDDFDVARSSVLQEFTTKLNCLDYDGQPMSVQADRVNYCTHLMRDCPCAKRYDELCFISVHSLYYLHDADMDAIAYVHPNAVINAVVHRPEEGTSLPKDKPEFMWVSTASAPHLFTWRERLVSMVRGRVMNEPTVAFVPLANDGTVYKHDAMGWLAAGGKHVSPTSRLVDQVTNSAWLSCLMVLMVLFVMLLNCAALFDWGGQVMAIRDAQAAYDLAKMGFAARYGQYVRWWCPPTLWLYRYFESRVLLPHVIPNMDYGFCWLACALTLGLISMFFAMRLAVLRTKGPGLLTDYTVTVRPVTAFADGRDEAIADLIEVAFGEPRELPFLTFGTVRVEPEVYLQALSIFSSCGADDKTASRVFSTMLRRYGYPVELTEDTVRRARERHGTLNLGGPTRPPITRSGPGLISAFLRLMWKPLSALGYLSAAAYVLARYCAYVVMAQFVIVMICLALAG